jgi:two-component system, NtrC family, response regulator HydG
MRRHRAVDVDHRREHRGQLSSNVRDWDQATTPRHNAGAGNLGESHRLSVIEGPDAGITFALEEPHASSWLVGQSPLCDVRLRDAEVSRRHASLERAGTSLSITDLGSTNHTFVDGTRIGQAFLRGGEVVRLGATALRVDVAAARHTSALPARSNFGRVIGESAEMRRLYPLCERLAASTVPVILEGETGTGKEQLAEALHELGPRVAGPYVVFDCTAVPANLLEAELFGHERGAFTGASTTRKGMFEQASGGTLLIDEIGELDLMLQPKLLRAIERGEVRRVGGDRAIRVDVRVLSATRRDLDREVQAGRFRDDLFHRLAVARLELPPLRRRAGDVAVLMAHFWTELGGDPSALTPDLVQSWEGYAWPGNVRELRNAVARRIALGALSASHPSGAVESPPSDHDAMERALRLELPLTHARQQVIDAFERLYVEQTLARHGGNVVRAAAAAGVSRRYFQILRSHTGR